MLRPCFQRAWRSISRVGAPFWALREGHADAPAVAVEDLPICNPHGFGDGLHPPGDLGLRQPEDFLVTAITTAPQVRAAASERLNPASDSTATRATSNLLAPPFPRRGRA